jgi:hypothetical protein
MVANGRPTTACHTSGNISVPYVNRCIVFTDSS